MICALSYYENPMKIYKIKAHDNLIIINLSPTYRCIKG